jgi:hypothetical protein
MADLNSDALARMVQEMGLSPVQLQNIMQDPASMMELMQRMSPQNPPLSRSKNSGFEDYKRQIEAARARWEEEARLPPVKVYPSQRHDMELENREVERQMLQFRATGSVLQTFLGQDRPFSTSPLAQLKKGSCRLLDIQAMLSEIIS